MLVLAFLKVEVPLECTRVGVVVAVGAACSCS